MPTRFVLVAALAAATFAPAAADPGVPFAVAQASLNNPNVPTGDGDAIFVVDESGNLEPFAARMHGTFMKAEPTDGSPGKLNSEANASISTGGNKVHLIFGGRVVATVPAEVKEGRATVKLPKSLHLGGAVNALASPTLGVGANGTRRAPTASERTAALDLAAAKLGTTRAKLTVANLTALDLGRGVALIGTVNRKGTGTPRKDKRLFFVAEPANGKLALTLANAQSITVTEPMLEEIKEQLVDAIDLGDGHLSLVTREVGYDAHTYVIYSHAGTGWKSIYSAGGVAL